MDFPEPDIRWRANGKPAGPSLAPRLLSREMFTENAAEYLLHNAQRFGDFVWFRALGREVFQFNHPDLISDMLVRDGKYHHRNLVMQRSKAVLGEGMLTSEEPLHMRQRRLAQPAFHRARIAAYGEIIARMTARTVAEWTGQRKVEAHAAMLLLALRIVGKTLFDMEVDDEVHTIAAAVDSFQTFLPLAFLPFPHLVQRLPIPAMRRIRRGRENVDRLIYRMIAERRADPTDRGDLLSMLMASVDAEAESGTEARMTDAQVRDECVTVLLAGHETTANALTFSLWALAANQELQESLAEDIRKVLGERSPGAEDYPQLGSAEQVFAESLRLYAPVWVTSRTAAESYEYRGVTIPKGAFLLAPQFAVHRDPRWWNDPLQFNPARFAKEEKAARPRFAYFPFGGGNRQCIGEGLSWMEGVLCLAVLVQNLRFSLPDGAKRTIAVQPSVTMRPKEPVHLVIERRP